MGNIRLLTSKIFDNEIFGTFPPLVRILYLGLWVYADREGRLTDSPARIKKNVLGYDDISLSQVDEMLQVLADAGFIIRYNDKNNKEKYIQIYNFTKYQRPGNDEPDSTIPCPDGYEPPVFQMKMSNFVAEEKPVQKKRKKTEPKEDPHDANETPYVIFPLKDGTEYPVYTSLVLEYQQTYPNVDVYSEVNKMKLWLDSNPQKQKTKVGIKRFMNSWISRASEKGGNRTYSGFAGAASAGVAGSKTLSDLADWINT